MIIRATRTLSALTARALFYGALFVVVVILHMALTTALRQVGWSGGASLFASGAAVLGLVLALVNGADWLREKRAAALEIARMRHGLPSGPCCVIWRAGDSASADDSMPWRIEGPLRVRYPALARRLGVEGVAIAEFEVAADGAAKNIHCVYTWPSDVFFASAREALAHATFRLKTQAPVRFGASYRMPFVFRIAGASTVKDAGSQAARLRPSVAAVRRAVEKLRRHA